MAVGLPLKTTYANGDVYSASDVNDTNGTVNLFTSSTLSRAAAKNCIINGGFDIAQRGTSGTFTTTAKSFCFDRWYISSAASASMTYSQQASTVAGTRYCGRVGRTAGNTNTTLIALQQDVETSNSIIYAGQSIVVSFYARAGANFSSASSALSHYTIQGTGTDQSDYSAGFTGRSVLTSGTATLTTSWQRFSYTATVASSTTELNLQVYYTPVGTAGANDYFEITGVQFELGSTATTFSRAGGTIQGELANCQRYYYRINATASAPWSMMAYGSAGSTTIVYGNIPLKADMRVIPTSVDYSSLCVSADNLASAQIAISSATVSNYISPGQVTVNLVGSGFTQYRPYWVHSNNTSAGYLGVSAEL